MGPAAVRSGKSPHFTHSYVPRPNQRCGIQCSSRPQYGQVWARSCVSPMASVGVSTPMCSPVQLLSGIETLTRGATAEEHAECQRSHDLRFYRAGADCGEAATDSFESRV